MSKRGAWRVAAIGAVASVVWMASTGAVGQAVGAATAASPAQSWPMFGHDALHSSVTVDSALTSLTAPKLHVAWSRRAGTTPKSMAASPVVAFDAALQKTVVYGVNSAGSVEAVDADTGKVIWQATVPYGIAGPDQAQGDVSTPAIDGDTLYFGTTAALVAMDATTGAIDCSFAIPVEPPATLPGIIDSSPVVGHLDASGPVVFFGDKGQSEFNNGGHEWAVTGVGNTHGACQLAWTFDGWLKQTAPNKLVGSWASPALVQDADGTWLLLMGSSDPDDAEYALNAVTGAIVWRFQTPPMGPDHDVGAAATISPPGANGAPDGVVYVEGKDFIEFAIDLSTGRQLWSFDMGKDTGVNVDAVSSGALDGNTLYVPYAHWVYAFDASTGAVVWKANVGAGTFYSSSSIAVPAAGDPGDPVLLLGSTTGNVFAFDGTTGAVLAKVSLGSAVFASAAFYGATAFEADAGGSIVALTVLPVVPTVRLTGSPVAGDNTYGVTLTVPATDPTPTAGVTVSDSGGNSCAATLTGSGTSYTGSCTISSETAGQKVSASFGGDANYAAATSAQTLTVRAPTPSVAAVSPAAGPLKGGTVITITGTGFGTAARVTVGTVRSSKVQFISTGELTAVVPAGTAGTVPVVVTTAGGSSPVGAPGTSFTYDPVPVVSGLSVSTAVGTAGGTQIDISGSGFTADSTVALAQGQGPVVNAVPWTVTNVTTTDITAIVAPSKLGSFAVFVTTPGGVSKASSAAMFAVVPAPPGG